MIRDPAGRDMPRFSVTTLSRLKVGVCNLLHPQKRPSGGCSPACRICDRETASVLAAALCAHRNPTRLPPLSQESNHLRRQHDVAILVALGLLDPNDLLPAV